MIDPIVFNYIILTIILLIIVVICATIIKASTALYKYTYNSYNGNNFKDFIAIHTKEGSLEISKSELVINLHNIKKLINNLKESSTCDMTSKENTDECNAIKTNIILSVDNMRQFVLDNDLDAEKIYILNYKIMDVPSGLTDSNSADDEIISSELSKVKNLQHLFTELSMYIDYTVMILDKKQTNGVKGILDLQYIDELIVLMYKNTFSVINEGSVNILDTFDNTADKLNEENINNPEDVKNPFQKSKFSSNNSINESRTTRRQINKNLPSIDKIMPYSHQIQFKDSLEQNIKYKPKSKKNINTESPIYPSAIPNLDVNAKKTLLDSYTVVPY
jgi:hypothetical protein